MASSPASVSLPMFYLQHFQPPQSPESSFLNAADLVLVQLSVKQGKVTERMACCLQRGRPDILINHSISLKSKKALTPIICPVHMC